IADPLLSRIHSRIEHGISSPFAVVDNDSTNLTIVNEHDITRTDLRNGDVILLGDTEIRVELVGSPANDVHEQTTRELPMRRGPQRTADQEADRVND
ncbi:MAG: FHA domain-containing protein, partial [Planctomycetaceae bacterium]|nr:FHA domain-containing protein [Planctomycetaceae bacterium]